MRAFPLFEQNGIVWVCLRLIGIYFAMLTFAFAQLVWSLVFQWGTVIGEDDWLVNIWPAEWLKPTVVYFYFVLIFSVSGILLMRHVQHSPSSYALRAARDSQRQAEAAGSNTRRVQLIAGSLRKACERLGLKQVEDQ